MNTAQLLENLEFNDKNPYAQPLYVSQEGRILRFTFRPGQGITEHDVPNSPFYVIVLKGYGMFTGGDGKESRFGPNSLLIFEPGESHAIRALDEELVFVAFLQGVPTTRPGKVGGELAQEPG